jgi:hypothetical protein
VEAGRGGEPWPGTRPFTIAQAPGLTTGQLHALARRLVISADPAARQRKEQALKDARVEAFTEHAGLFGRRARRRQARTTLAQAS